MCVFEEGFGGAETDELRKINKYICDFSRGGLNARLRARIQTLLRGHKYDLFIFQRADLGWIWGIKSKEGGFEEEMEGDRWFSSV